MCCHQLHWQVTPTPTQTHLLNEVQDGGDVAGGEVEQHVGLNHTSKRRRQVIFLRILCHCHTILTNKGREGDNTAGELVDCGLNRFGEVCGVEGEVCAVSGDVINCLVQPSNDIFKVILGDLWCCTTCWCFWWHLHGCFAVCNVCLEGCYCCMN